MNPFLRSMIRTAVLLAPLILAEGARACATCFGASDSKMAQGMNMGILALLGVIGTVLAGFAAFFITLAVRSARSSAATESSNAPLPQSPPLPSA